MKRNRSKEHPPSTKSASKKRLITDYFATSGKSPDYSIEWLDVGAGSILHGRTKPLQSGKTENLGKKWACFDLDNTLITTKGSHIFARHEFDWKWLDSEIPRKLKKLSEDEYRIIIFSNQMSLDINGRDEMFKSKIHDICKRLNLPFDIVAATRDDCYRKPSTGMFEYINRISNETDLSSSFYVGDAAGRPSSKGRKRDHSDCDIKFAYNIGIPFFTPEEYFFGAKKLPIEFSFDPSKIRRDVPLHLPENTPLVSSSQEVIVTVGFPACGKTFFIEKYLLPEGYLRISFGYHDDTKLALANLKQALSDGKSVVLEGNHPDLSSRSKYIDIAREFGIKARCYQFLATEDLARHCNVYRYRVFGHRKLPRPAFDAFKAKFKGPSKDEGFSEIKCINFVPDFDDTSHENTFRKFLF